MNALHLLYNYPPQVFKFWNEMCGRGTSDTSGVIATATADARAISPDIVTVTDVIAALERSSAWRDKSDLVFSEAVEKKILLKEDSLDSMWEVDLSGVSFPVAHTAIRYVLKRLMEFAQQGGKETLQDMTFITGVGLGQKSQRDDVGEEGLTPVTLREFVRETLRNEYEIYTTIPKFAMGTVVIKKEMLVRWMNNNQRF